MFWSGCAGEPARGEELHALLRQLDSPGKQERASAAYRLQSYREGRVFDALLRRIRDPVEHDYVKRNAIQGLYLGGTEPELLPHYLDLLKTSQGWLWDEATRAVGRYGPKASEAVPLLLAGLSDDDRRLWAASALGEIGDRAAVPALIAAVRKHGSSQAAEALGKIRDRAAVPVLIEALRSGEYTQSGYAAWALGEMKAKEALPALQRGVFVDSCDIKNQTFECAIAIKKITGTLDPGVWNRVESMLECAYFKNLRQYLRIFARSGDKDFIRPIVECLDPHEVSRFYGNFANYRKSIAGTLGLLAGERLGSDYDAWRLWLLRQEHDGKLPPLPSGWNDLIKALDPADRGSAVRAVAKLGRTGDVRAAPELEAFYQELPEGALELRAETLRALALLGKSSAFRRLFLLSSQHAAPERKRILLARLEGIRNHRIPPFLASLCYKMLERPEWRLEAGVLRAAKDSFRMPDFFCSRDDSQVVVVEMAERTLFLPQKSLAWREAAEALTAICGVPLLRDETGDPKTARRLAQRTWASWIVSRAVAALIEKPEPPLPEAGRGDGEGTRWIYPGTRAGRAFLWLHSHGPFYKQELEQLRTDRRPLGQQHYIGYDNCGAGCLEPVRLKTVGDAAKEALLRACFQHYRLP